MTVPFFFPARHGDVRAATAILKLVMEMRSTFGVASAAHATEPAQPAIRRKKMTSARRRGKAKRANGTHVPSLRRALAVGSP